MTAATGECCTRAVHGGRELGWGHDVEANCAWPVVAGLTFRPLAVPDAGAWLELVVRIAEAEDAPWHDQLSDLMEVLESAANPAAENTLVGVDGGGVPRAYGYVAKNAGGPVAFVLGGVDPLWQRRGIGRRGAGVAAGCGAGPIRRRGPGRAPWRAVLLPRGKHARTKRCSRLPVLAVVRYFTEMERPLARPSPDRVSARRHGGAVHARAGRGRAAGPQ